MTKHARELSPLEVILIGMVVLVVVLFEIWFFFLLRVADRPAHRARAQGAADRHRPVEREAWPIRVTGTDFIYLPTRDFEARKSSSTAAYPGPAPQLATASGRGPSSRPATSPWP